MKPLFTLSLLGVFSIVLSRVLPHLPNFVPVIAFSIFAYKYSRSLWVSILIPLVSIWISDLVINNIIYTAYFPEFTWYTPGTFYNVLPYVLIPFIHHMTKRFKYYWLTTGMLSSVLFFLISNFGVWVSTQMYTPDLAGLLTCYLAGATFLTNTLLSTLVFGLLFELFAKIIQLKPTYAL